jgi:phosphonate transport system substrate-binding protein
MAAVASVVLEQMATRGTVKLQDFRVIYTSPVFPTSSFAHAHDLKPDLAAKLKQCFFSFRFTPAMQKELFGGDRFVPITYAKDWAVVRDVAEKSGTPYNRAAYEAESKREAEAAAKRAAAAAAAPAKKQ